MTNPLLATWETPFELPPFDQIEDSHFEPALNEALEVARAAVAEIAEAEDPPSFANTIEALERADALLDRVAGVFFNLAGSDATPEREKLQRDFAPKFSAYGSEIIGNQKLWQRIRTLWDGRDDLDLTQEQSRLLYLKHRAFLRGGAALEGAPSCNGWTYWHFEQDGARMPIDLLRQKIRADLAD